MKSLASLFAASLFFVPELAHAAKYKLDLTASENQRSRMDNGVEAIDSDMPKSSVRLIESEEKVGKRGTLAVFAINAGDTPTNLGVENVSFEGGAPNNIAVIPYERLLKEEKNRQMWAAIAVGLSAGANSMNASMSGYSSANVSTYGRYGYSTSTITAYNPAAASMATSLANSQNMQMFDRLGDSNAASLAALKVNLRTSTIDPGQNFGGQVTYELPKSMRSSKKPIPVVIHVKVGDDVHVFNASLVPAK